MLASSGTAGYHPSYALRTAAEFEEPRVRVQGYTEPRLTRVQHSAVVLGVSAATALLKRPLVKMDAFYFLSDVPGESNRIYASDKRAQFFRTIFSVRWFSGQPLLWSMLEYVFLLASFTWLRERLPWGGNTLRGFAAGGLAGVMYAAVRHPYDVLRTTSEAVGGPKKFKGVGDVVKTALREKPSVLLGVYRGVTAVACGRLVQFGAQFGVYNATRYDGVYHHTCMLFLYCHLGAVLGLFLQYPFLSVKQQLHLRNQFTRGRPHTYRSYIREVRARHGITKVFDGFFTSRPMLNAVPAALLMTLYDVCTRSYTEFIHPELRKLHAEVDQPIFSASGASYASSLPAYEFAGK
ncbi:solute carrier family 25 (mitochondrial adenine nucleotide translocator), member 4/5/6/31 [Trypanosoma conorhini]|uniref:Solute carrier family 25 (Mitochondrial adenine nucleotide translocator), member 4/5/6/31 n=1 Tax=Trypanosoma conorhini TaxID=83891 RepID=A0A3S5IUJ1_9TRYP|nr:solute carrier family 25 (mitochondrial adenine nucleotide translocator), member 4/5/6/31 [Trypanosoma conorhini]RNF26166.1 solute carrier family 25 (mitochondrial adenine nucleotide translocator), member 4/5/6/31 [Trypanosoma conorhini]